MVSDSATMRDHSGADGGAKDVVQPFQLDASNLRGRHVVLDDVLNDIIDRHDYPRPVARLMSEALVVAVLLADMLKFDGVFTLQAKGDGAVPLLVIDITSAHELRGYAMVDHERLDRLEAQPSAEPAASAGDLLGQGYLAFTVDPGQNSEQYQGIVELEGESMADFVRHYFRQSEQIDTGLKVAVEEQNGDWRAAAISLQRLPDQPQAGEAAPQSQGEEDWRRTMMLLGTASSEELLDPAIPPRALLYRLFHEEGVRVFPVTPLARGCRCSEERVISILAGISAESLAEYADEAGQVTMTCEFCAESYVFTLDQIAERARAAR